MKGNLDSMISIRHVGVYVNDLEKAEQFYSEVFSMRTIVSHNPEQSEMLDDLFRQSGARILTTKLITPYGCETGTGDMLELIKVVSFEPGHLPGNRMISETGMGHVAFGVTDIENVSNKIAEHGGRMMTKVYTMPNGNKCAFAQDPEENWIELIQRAEKTD